MKKQSTQLLVLGSLVAVWAILWHLFIKLPEAPASAKPPPAKTVQGESLLHMRFRHIRAEMDFLYHYRAKPSPFEADANPFRAPPGVDLSDEGEAPTPAAPGKGAVVEGKQAPGETQTPEGSEALIKAAVANMRIGGVVVINGTVKLTIEGQLHKEGDVFTVKLPPAGKSGPRSVIVRVKRLSDEFVTFDLADAAVGRAELKVRLN